MTANIIFLGPPGSGKGTQSEFVANEFGMVRLAMGDLLREEVSRQTPEGLKIGALIDEGHMAPDVAILDIVRKALQREASKSGILFDGFPRNIVQAEMLNHLSQEFEFAIAHVFHFNIRIETLLERIRGRLICANCKKIFHEITQPPRLSGICDACAGQLVRRHDDENEALVRTRYQDYLSVTEPLIEYYRDILIDIDAAQTKFVVYDAVKSVLLGAQ